MSEEEQAAFLKERGWEYGKTRQHGWKWAHRNLPQGVYFGLKAAFVTELREKVSEKELVCHN